MAAFFILMRALVRGRLEKISKQHTIAMKNDKGRKGKAFL